MRKADGNIKKFRGTWGEDYDWEGKRSRTYPASNEYAQVTENWLIGKPEGAVTFAMRYYRVEKGGFTRLEDHPYDHGILILHGQGEVLIGEDPHTFRQGDVIYIPPDARHQLTNTGDGPMGFLCIIPAKRLKGGETVWADEIINFDPGG